MRVEIAGALACGKTTLSRRLESIGCHLVSEDLSTNPYLELRRQDPEKYDFLCQQRFVEDKLGALEAAVAAGHARVLSDYCMAAERAYLQFYLSDKPHWIERLERMIDDSAGVIGMPDAVIYLKCRPETQLARIRERGRAFEQGHDVAFLERINGLVHGRVEEIRNRGVTVLDFASEDVAVSPGRVAEALAGIGFGPAAKPSRSALQPDGVPA